MSTAALLLAASPAGAVSGYGDVAEDRYFTEPVQWSVDNSITGLTNACFSPDRTVTRVEAARWLWTLQDRPQAPAHTFTDVYESAAVSWMVHAGVTTGTSATTFSPDDPLTRAEIAAFLWRIENQPEVPAHTFTDVHRPWQQGPVSWMVHAGVTTGTSATTFSPDDPLTRAHLVTFLWRYQNRPTVTINPDTPTCHSPATVTEGTCPGSTRSEAQITAIEETSEGNARTVEYRLPDGALHCTDGPARIIYRFDGTVSVGHYYRNGELRDDGPAVISYDRDGTVYESYYLNGERHRDDGPAVIAYYPDGTVWYETYARNGERHRDDGPAHVEYTPEGTVFQEVYRLNDKRHRDDGPARIYYYPDGTVFRESYWLNGELQRLIEYNPDGTVKSDSG